jgi:RecJ-like exonuclease
MHIQCPRCKGTGKDPEIIAECGLCGGRGHLEEKDAYLEQFASLTKEEFEEFLNKTKGKING